MNRFLPACSAALAGLVVALPAAAQFQKPEDAVKYRESAMFVMANHVGRIGAMVQGRVPYDAAAATQNAELVKWLTKDGKLVKRPVLVSGKTVLVGFKPEAYAKLFS